MKRKRRTKGLMARSLVYFCIIVLTATGVWATVLKTVEPTADLTDVLTFVGAAFGGELILLLAKRIFATDNNKTKNEINGGEG